MYFAFAKTTETNLGMPVFHISRSSASLWGIWQIAEDESTLASALGNEQVPADITNPLKRLEYLSVRLLLKTLLTEWSLPYNGLRKDKFGKPFLIDIDAHISLSHSYPYVAAILHRDKNVGIDLEQPKSKLLRIAPRVLSGEELADAGDDLTKHCIYWCAKESLVKIYGQKDLVFCDHLRVNPFELQPQGDIMGHIIANNTETPIPLSYLVFESFVLVVSA